VSRALSLLVTGLSNIWLTPVVGGEAGEADAARTGDEEKMSRKAAAAAEKE